MVVLALLSATTMHAVESIETVASKAVAAVNRGEYELAVRMTRTALGTWPRDPNLLNVAAVGFSGINLQDSAKAYSLKAIEIAPTFAPAYVSYAAACSKLKEWDEVLAYAERGLSLNANEPTLVYFRDRARDELRVQKWAGWLAACASLLLAVILVLTLRSGPSDSRSAGSLAALGAAGLVTLILYHAFYALSDVIWSFSKSMSVADVLPHVRGFVLERDGIEGYVLFAQTVLSIAMAVLFVSVSRMASSAVWRRSLLILSIVATIIHVVTVGVYPPQASVIAPLTRLIPLLLGIGAITGLMYVLQRFVPSIGTIVMALFLFACCFVASEAISLVDYSFILAPTIRLLQGAQIQDIYLQYDLLPSLISAAWLNLDLRLETVEVIGQLSMFIFMVAVFGFSRSFFRDQRIPVILLVTMLIIRTYANMHNPTALLQVTSLRLDWWLLLVVLTYYRGAFDWTLGVAFGVLLIVHKNFAIIYLASYLLFCSVLAMHRLVANRATSGSLSASIIPTVSYLARSLWLNLAIIFGALAINVVLFGSIMPESALLYQKLGLGMLPIDRHSFFWIVALVLPTVFLLVSRLRESLPNNYVETSIFLVALTAGSLLYFFGRSHENNLLNISSILVLLIFLMLDLIGIGAGVRIVDASPNRKEKSSKTNAPLRWMRTNVGFVLGLAFLTSAVVFYSGSIVKRVESQVQNIRKGRLHMAPTYANINVDALRRLAEGHSGIYVMDFKNDFLYYTLGGFEMTGFFNPCGAWVLRNDLAAHLDTMLRERRVIIAQDLIQHSSLLGMTKHNFSKADNGIYAFTLEQARPMLPVRSGSMVNVVIPRPLRDAAVYRSCTPSSDTFSIEFTVKTSALEPPGSRLLTLLGGGNLGVVLQTAAERRDSYLVGIGNGANWNVPFVLQLPPDQWHHIVLSFRDRTLRVTLSDKLVYEGPISTSFKDTPMQLTVGRPVDVEPYFRGDIRDVVIGSW